MARTAEFYWGILYVQGKKYFVQRQRMSTKFVICHLITMTTITTKTTKTTLTTMSHDYNNYNDSDLDLALDWERFSELVT